MLREGKAKEGCGRGNIREGTVVLRKGKILSRERKGKIVLNERNDGRLY